MQNVKKEPPEVFFKKFCNILMKIPVLESLFKKTVATQLFSCKDQEIFKYSYSEEHLWTAASECRLQQEWIATFACKTGRNGLKPINYVSYLFVSFWYYYICALSRESCAEVFFKKVFLKMSQNSQENTSNRVSFLSATSNFIKKENPAHLFPCEFCKKK